MVRRKNEFMTGLPDGSLIPERLVVWSMLYKESLRLTFALTAGARPYEEAVLSLCNIPLYKASLLSVLIGKSERYSVVYIQILYLAAIVV